MCEHACKYVEKTQIMHLCNNSDYKCVPDKSFQCYETSIDKNMQKEKKITTIYKSAIEQIIFIDNNN